MAFDSSVLCARTSAGEAELALARQGLSLGQRRVLTLLQNPAAVDELAQNHRLEPDKLARDLTRLAELHLVVLQGPTLAQETAATAPVPPNHGGSAPTLSNIGGKVRPRPTLPLAAGAAALALTVGAWYVTRTGEQPIAIPRPPVATPAPPTLAAEPSPTPPVAATAHDTAPVVMAPDPTTLPRGNAAPSDARPEIRQGLPAATTGPAQSATAQNGSEPKAAPRTDVAVASASATPSPLLPAPISTSAQAVEPDAKSGATADRPAPPVVAVAPSVSAAPRPAAATELKAVSRDAPDFPREAIAAGVKGGVVNARIHVDPNGKVTAVDIIGAQPSHVFDRAVRSALSRWQFEPIAAARSYDVELNFQRD